VYTSLLTPVSYVSGVPALDLVALAIGVMTPGNNIDALDADSKRLWACSLVDVVSFVCLHLTSHIVDAGQASVHAERGGGARATRSERAAVRVRRLVMVILEHALVSWAPTGLFLWVVYIYA